MKIPVWRLPGVPSLSTILVVNQHEPVIFCSFIMLMRLTYQRIRASGRNLDHGLIAGHILLFSMSPAACPCTGKRIKDLPSNAVTPRERFLSLLLEVLQVAGPFLGIVFSIIGFFTFTETMPRKLILSFLQAFRNILVSLSCVLVVHQIKENQSGTARTTGTTDDQFRKA